MAIFVHFNGLDHDTNLVARPLAEIFAKFNLMELHVSLSQGLWRYDKWGYPVGRFSLVTFSLAGNEIPSN